MSEACILFIKEPQTGGVEMADGIEYQVSYTEEDSHSRLLSNTV